MSVHKWTPWGWQGPDRAGAAPWRVLPTCLFPVSPCPGPKRLPRPPWAPRRPRHAWRTRPLWDEQLGHLRTRGPSRCAWAGRAPWDPRPPGKACLPQLPVPHQGRLGIGVNAREGFSSCLGISPTHHTYFTALSAAPTSGPQCGAEPDPPGDRTQCCSPLRPSWLSWPHRSHRWECFPWVRVGPTARAWGPWKPAFGQLTVHGDLRAWLTPCSQHWGHSGLGVPTDVTVAIGSRNQVCAAWFPLDTILGPRVHLSESPPDVTGEAAPRRGADSPFHPPHNLVSNSKKRKRKKFRNLKTEQRVA